MTAILSWICGNTFHSAVDRCFDRRILVVSALGSLLLTGCNRSQFNLGDVEGTVTFDGRPLAGASLLFQPQDGTGTVSVGGTDSQGHYSLVFTRKQTGAVVGIHSVTVNLWPSEDAPSRSMVRIPAKYNAKTELKADVKSGPNVIDFALTSK